MKQHLRFLFLLATLISMVTINVHAYDAEIDGIFYNFNGDEAEVTYSTLYSNTDYKDDVKIPETVIYNGKTYQVTAIGENAFRSRRNLNSVSIPNTVKTIGEEAFAYTYLSKISLGNSVTNIGLRAFYQCQNMSSVSLPNSLTTIGDRAFQECVSISSLTIPENVIIIGEDAFYRCTSLNSITIPNSVKSVGKGAFSHCSGLESVTIGNSLSSISNNMFSWCSKLKSITIPENISTIEEMAFEQCGNLESIIIPNSVTSIGLRAFYYCDSLSYISFGKSIENIGDNAFDKCFNLADVNITDLEAWSRIKINKYFDSCPMKYAKRLFLNGKEVRSLVIPNSITEIRSYLFGNIQFQSLTIGPGVLSIGNDPFAMPMKTIWLTNTPPSGYKNAMGIINYVSNNLYDFKDNYTLTYVYPQLSSMFTRDGIKYVVIDIPSLTCDAIDCVYDESAELTKLGTTVDYNAKRTFKVLNVMPYTCCGNSFIKNVELGDLPYIDDHVFDGCTNLQSVKLPETIAGLGISSFQDCASLTEIAIPSATSIVMYNAFKGCNSLQNVTMNDGTDPLTLAYNDERLKINYKTNKVELYNGTPLFEDCPLDYVYIGRNISYSAKQEAGYSPFYRNTSLRSVRITDQETEIGENEFYGCSGLKNVWIGDGVTTIGNWAFSGCSSLDFFEFGNSMQTIGKEAFSDCSNVTRIISHAITPPVCGSQALDDIQKTEFNGHPGCELYIPQGCEATYSVADQWSQFWLNMYEYDPTAVRSITTTTDAPDVYSLSGQRLAAPRKGINIIGGKKILMR